MIKTGFFNDSPILIPDDDHFGIDPFAEAIAKRFIDIESPIGVTIAINGPWGSGKSSAVNLICHHLKNEVNSGKLKLIDFKCWWFRGEEALTLAFLQELNASIQKTLGEKAKELIPRLGKKLLQAGPVVGPVINFGTGGIWGTLTSKSMDYVKKYFSETESVEKLFKRLSDALESQDKRFLVLIDDIDRLTPNEAILIFRLVKSVGRLPNVMYLLAFDRELAETAVQEIYPSEGPHFLDKIIQASFELPLPAHDDLQAEFMSNIEELCGLPKEKDRILRFMNIFYDAVFPYLNTPRDLTRLANTLSVSWPAVAQEVDLADYLALEIIRLYDPQLYKSIRTNKNRLCGIRSQYDHKEDPEQEIQEFLELVPEQNRDQTKLTMKRLFPRLENTSYSTSFMDIWEAQRRVCITKHFDTYFRMSLGDETLSIAEVEAIIQHAGDAEYVKKAFWRAHESIRKNGKSKVPLLLDELNVHASKIDKSCFQALISAIFEIADDIYRDGDCGHGDLFFVDTYLKIHWLIRKLALERCTFEERSSIFVVACQKAQVGWLVDFTSSAILDHYPSEGRQPEPSEKCLIVKEHITDLKDHAVDTIRTMAANGKLVFHPRLSFILFRWRDFSEDHGYEVKEWTNSQLMVDDFVSMFAQAFTKESWSQGMGLSGLSDRVAMRNVQASINGLEEILDVDGFRLRLEELENSETLSGPQKDNVLVFLQAWREEEAKGNRYGHG